MSANLLMCVTLALSAVGATDWDDYFLWKESAIFAGDKVQILVRSYRHLDSPPDSPQRIDNDRGYLIIGSLDRQGKLIDKPKVVGPLWHVQERHDGAVAWIGAPFNNEDRRILQQFPRLRHLTDGTFERLRPTKNGKVWIRDRLTVDGKTAAWVENGTYREVPVLPSGDEPGMQSKDLGYIVGQRRGGTIAVYRTDTGEKIHDEWLEKIFSNLKQVAGEFITFARITNDLNAVVFLPFANEFVAEGKQFDGASHGLAYQRPSLKSTIFKHEKDPQYVLLVKGEIGLFNSSDNELTIASIRGTPKYRVPVGHLKPLEFPITASKWGETLFEYRVTITSRKREARWRAWQYLKDTLVESRIDIEELFKLRPEGLVPENAIPVSTK